MGGLVAPADGASSAATGDYHILSGGQQMAQTAADNPIDAFFRASRYSRDDVVVVAAAVQLVMVAALVVAEVG